MKVQQVKVFVAKAEELSSISRTHILEGMNQLSYNLCLDDHSPEWCMDMLPPPSHKSANLRKTTLKKLTIKLPHDPTDS